MKKLGITTLAAIHDINLAATYCDKIYCDKKRKIVLYGSVEELLTKENMKEIFDLDVNIEKNKFGYYNVLYRP